LHAVAEHDPDEAQKAMLDHLSWAEEDLRGAEA
jgi:DNA-binding FadR family transcriptional regulator